MRVSFAVTIDVTVCILFCVLLCLHIHHCFHAAVQTHDLLAIKLDPAKIPEGINPYPFNLWTVMEIYLEEARLFTIYHFPAASEYLMRTTGLRYTDATDNEQGQTTG